MANNQKPKALLPRHHLLDLVAVSPYLIVVNFDSSMVKKEFVEG